MNNGVSVTSGLAGVMLAQSPPAEYLEITANGCPHPRVPPRSGRSAVKCSLRGSNDSQMVGQIVGQIGGQIVKMLNKLCPSRRDSQRQVGLVSLR